MLNPRRLQINVIPILLIESIFIFREWFQSLGMRYLCPLVSALIFKGPPLVNEILWYYLWKQKEKRDMNSYLMNIIHLSFAMSQKEKRKVEAWEGFKKTKSRNINEKTRERTKDSHISNSYDLYLPSWNVYLRERETDNEKDNETKIEPNAWGNHYLNIFLCFMVFVKWNHIIKNLVFKVYTITFTLNYSIFWPSESSISYI
jgi:hypothetical protein